VTKARRVRYRYVSISARWQAERRDDRNFLAGLNQPDLSLKQVYRLRALARYAAFREFRIDELPMRIVCGERDQRLTVQGRRFR
jgi:hypothetical protein